MEVKRKIRNSRGFTLAETLLAVIILLLVSGIVASGIPAAKNAYEKVVLASNAEALLSTTISTLRNELGTAREPETPAAAAGEKNTVITYYNPGRSSASQLDIQTNDGVSTIVFWRYYNEENPGTPVRLISKEQGTRDLYVTYDAVDYDKDTEIVTFYGLAVKRDSNGADLAKRDELSIRVITG